jgi:hypothetical protein
VADKDLDELAKAATKAAFATTALTAAHLAMRKVTDQVASTIGAFDKQVTKAASDVEDLASKVGTFNKEAAKAADNARQMADTFGNLLDKLTPLSAVLKDVGDRLQVTTVSIGQSSTAINIHSQALAQLQAASVDAANGQGAVSEALGKTEAAADKSSEKLKKVQETAKELGSSMIDAITALASGEEPMKVLAEKGGDVAKMLLKAKVDGVSLVETFKSLGLATGILQIATTSAAAAQDVNAVSAGAATAAMEAQTVAAGELAAAESVALAPLGVILAGIAVAAAGVATVFAIAAHDIGEKAGDLTKNMGLTEEQMGRVKDKSVTMADVAKATFETLGDSLMGAFGPGLKAIGEGFMSAYHTVTDVSLKAAAFAVGVFAGAVQAIRVAWAVLPSAIGDIIISGVNLVLDGVGKMVNGAIGLANGLIGTVNWLAKRLGLSLELPDLGQVEVAKLTNQFAGAAKLAGSAISTAFGNGFKGGFEGVMDIPGQIAGRAVQIAKERIEKEAGAATPHSAAGSQDHDTTGRKAAEAVKSRDYDHLDRQEPISIVQDAPVDGLRPAVVNVEGLKSFEDPISKSLDALISKLTNINKLAPELGKQFEAAFGKTGKALGDVLNSFSAYSLEVAKIDKDAPGGVLTPEQQEKRTQAQIKGYASMAGAAKGFFKENSDGYKAMQVAEIAFSTFHTLNTIKSMALETTSAAHTATTQAAKQTSYGVTAYAHALAELPFPFNLLAGATVLAALVQVGVAIKGKPGGGAAPGANDMKTRQEAQVSGSVLGDSKAKSESLEKALTHAQAYENKDLEYGNAMVRSLKSIDDQIGAVASALAKSFGAGGMLSTEGLNLGKTGASASLSNFGFGKTTTRTLQDQGIQFNAATLADVLGGGLSGSTYQQVLEVTKKKALFMPAGSKSKVITETGALDGDFLDQVTKLIGALGKGVTDAASAIKATGVEEILSSFKVDLGKLSFKDMTGTQIEEALNAIFGKLGDDMAKAAVPAIAEFQKVGEGAFETLVRVARQYEVIDTTLKSVGMTFGAVGVASLGARERLVDLVGGLDNLTDQTAFFAEHFLSEDERLKPVKDTVKDRLTELKLPTDMTRDDFKKTVLEQNLSTKEGAELYAALMLLAPAFDKVATAAENAQKAIADKKSSIQDQIDELVLSPAELLAKSRKAEMKAVLELDKALGPFLETLWKAQDAAEAAKLATEQSGMRADLLEAQGRSDEAKALRRSLALAAIKDPVQQVLQQQIWAAQDAAEKVAAARDVLTQAYQREHDAIQATKDKFQELSTSLRAFSASLSGTIAGADLATRYRMTRQTFQATASLARLGDADAMGRLQADGEAFTAASRDYVSTSQDYLRDVGLVRSAVDEAADTADRQVSIAERQLEALDASVQGLIQINASVVSVRDAIAGLRAANEVAAAAGVGSVGGMPTGSTGGVGKYGGLLTDHSSDAASSDGKFVEGDLYDYDFHVEMRRRLEAQMEANRAMGYEKWKEKQEATAAEGEAWLDSVWGGYPGAYREAMDRIDGKGGVYDYNTPSWTENDWRAASGQPLQYATGGSFEVGGSGPPDSKLFNLALSPGEAVNVQRADQKNDRALINELRSLRDELSSLRASSDRIATSNDKMERTLTNVTEGGRAMQTQAAA